MHTDRQMLHTEEEGLVALKEREDVLGENLGENLEEKEGEHATSVSKIIQVQMPLGLIGFEDYSNFVFELSSDNPVVKMQSEDSKGLVFYLINPFDVRKDYQITLEEFDYQTLKTDSLDNVLVYSILTLHKDFEKISYNLLGPILLNVTNSIAKQCINSGWKTKYLLSTGEEISK